MKDNVATVAVVRAQQGDPRAFDCLVRLYQDRAVAYARTILRDSAAAEDAAQEAFVQAWRDLPRLSEPAAFGAWLRKLVFKYCDRIRRADRQVAPLYEWLPQPVEQGPAQMIERADDAASVRAAIDKLPSSLKESILLYYLSGNNIEEVAAFLDLPSSTVKNRLHAARGLLRKELQMMTERIFEAERPSQGDAFTNSVLTRVLRQFQEQERADPHSADRTLLDEGRTALFEMLAKGNPLDDVTFRDGFVVLWRRRDWQGSTALLMRRLATPLSDSETAWAYLHLANAIANSGSAAGAVLAHEAFERWLPGRKPSLSAQWPYYPAERNTKGAVYSGEEVRLLFLHQSAEFATSYLGVWRNDNYLAKVEAALAGIPVKPGNRLAHFYVLRMAAHTCETAGDYDRSGSYIGQMHALAAGAKTEAHRTEIEAKALGHEIRLAKTMADNRAHARAVARLQSLLDRAAARRSGNTGWVRSERHNLACQLVRAGLYDQALPLWKANEASGGQVNGWGWFLDAVTVWHLTHDRERTATLLGEARAHSDRDMAPDFIERSEFAEVRDDLQFLGAISMAGATG